MKIPQKWQKYFKFWVSIWTFWIGITIFIIAGYIFHESHNLDYFLLPFKVKKYPNKHRIKFYEFYIQPDSISCGPTSAAMILNHYGKPITIEEVKRQAKTVWFQYQDKDVGMTTPDFLSDAMNSFGIYTRVVQRGNLHFLKHQVYSGKPCIVLVRSGGLTWHYFVVIGYNPTQIIIADTNGTVLIMGTKQFINCWGWQSDVSGVSYENQTSCLATFLQFFEIYPYTMIISSRDTPDAM